MARITRPLTNNEILKAKPREKDFTLHDGDGLFLLVKTSGKKLWRFRYQRPVSSSRTNLSLGSYPALTLAAARQIRDQHLATLAQGMDPQLLQEQASEQRQIELDSIFSTVAANWFQIKSRSVTEDYAKDIWRSLVMSNLSVPTRCLIEWQLLTLVRPSEASGARWAEIDINAKLWTIPAERMKAKREHIVPLSSKALDVLHVMKPISSHREFIFPSRCDPKQPMNSQTANAALKRIGYGGKLVAHGMRSIASTAMNEFGFNADVIEAALAHIDKNEVRRAYNRSVYLTQREELMEWWGEQCVSQFSSIGNK